MRQRRRHSYQWSYQSWLQIEPRRWRAGFLFSVSLVSLCITHASTPHFPWPSIWGREESTARISGFFIRLKIKQGREIDLNSVSCTRSNSYCLDHFTENGVVFDDGSTLEADVVVLATSYQNMKVRFLVYLPRHDILNSSCALGYRREDYRQRRLTNWRWYSASLYRQDFINHFLSVCDLDSEGELKTIWRPSGRRTSTLIPHNTVGDVLFNHSRAMDHGWQPRVLPTQQQDWRA